MRNNRVKGATRAIGGPALPPGKRAREQHTWSTPIGTIVNSPRGPKEEAEIPPPRGAVRLRSHTFAYRFCEPCILNPQSIRKCSLKITSLKQTAFHVLPQQKTRLVAKGRSTCDVLRGR
jgi:hypothetical protein